VEEMAKSGGVWVGVGLFVLTLGGIVGAGVMGQKNEGARVEKASKETLELLVENQEMMSQRLALMERRLKRLEETEKVEIHLHNVKHVTQFVRDTKLGMTVEKAEIEYVMGQ
jgi:hypothetical protein